MKFASEQILMVCNIVYLLELWRDDLKCGPRYLLQNGDPAQCSAEDKKAHCCNTTSGECGNTAQHCKCETCIDFGIYNV